jgi:hypothetical protein
MIRQSRQVCIQCDIVTIVHISAGLGNGSLEITDVAAGDLRYSEHASLGVTIQEFVGHTLEFLCGSFLPEHTHSHYFGVADRRQKYRFTRKIDLVGRNEYAVQLFAASNPTRRAVPSNGYRFADLIGTMVVNAFGAVGGFRFAIGSATAPRFVN